VKCVYVIFGKRNNLALKIDLFLMPVVQNVLTEKQLKNSVHVYSVLSSERYTCYVVLKLQNISHYFSRRNREQDEQTEKTTNNLKISFF
jgi:hypothetical protein